MEDEKKTIREAFGRRLTARMAEKGWNKSELARQAALFMADGKFGRDLTAAYANGLSIPSPKRLEALCRALGCNPTDLLPPRPMRPTTAQPGSAPFSVAAVPGGKVHITFDQVVDADTAADLMQIILPRKESK